MKNPHWLYFLLLFTGIFFIVRKVRADEVEVKQGVVNESNKANNGSVDSVQKGKFGQWKVMVANDVDGGRVCYIYSKPIDFSGNHKEDRDARMVISIFNRSIKEVSISSGGVYRMNSKISVSIDGSQVSFVAESANVAWVEKYGSDDVVIGKLLKGFKVLVFSEFNTGTYAVDTYSLEGMRDAYNSMVNLCSK
ncbi:MAG: hypothetical protein RL208_645 [Pseudomonadota bacterium]|jgi:hypothetical protein